MKYIFLILLVSFNVKAESSCEILFSEAASPGDSEVMTSIAPMAPMMARRATPPLPELDTAEGNEDYSLDYYKNRVGLSTVGPLQRKLYKINWYRRLNGKRERATDTANREFISKINHFLSVGGKEGVKAADTAINDPVRFYQNGLFSETEQAAIHIWENDAKMAKGQLTSRQLITFIAAEKTVGRFGPLYLKVKRLLNKAKDPESTAANGRPYSDTYRKAAQDLYDKLGYITQIKGEFKNVPRIEANQNHPPLEYIVEKILDNSDVALNERLDRDILGERLTALRYFFYEILRNGLELTYKVVYEIAIAKNTTEENEPTAKKDPPSRKDPPAKRHIPEIGDSTKSRSGRTTKAPSKSSRTTSKSKKPSKPVKEIKEETEETEEVTTKKSEKESIVKAGVEATKRSVRWAKNKLDKLKVPFQIIMKAINDSRTRRMDLSKIYDVMYASKSPEEKLDDLRAKHRAEPKGTLLVSFARVFDVDQKIRTTWLQMKAEAQKKANGNIFDNTFYGEMVEAEKRALQPEYGEISEHEPQTPINRLATWVVAGSVSTAGLYHYFAPPDWPMWETIDTLIRVVSFQ